MVGFSAQMVGFSAQMVGFSAQMVGFSAHFFFNYCFTLSSFFEEITVRDSKKKAPL